jgi:hypothetical protein
MICLSLRMARWEADISPAETHFAKKSTSLSVRTKEASLSGEFHTGKRAAHVADMGEGDEELEEAA